MKLLFAKIVAFAMVVVVVLERVALVKSSETSTFAPTATCDDILCGIYSDHESVQTSMFVSFDLTLDQDIIPEVISTDLVDLFNRKMSAFAAGCEVFSHLEDDTLAIYNQYVHPISVQDVYRVEFNFTSNYFSEGDFTLIDGECESANRSIEGISCYPSTGFLNIFWLPLGGVNNATLNNEIEGYIQDIISAEMEYLSNDITSIHSISVLNFISEPSIAPSTEFLSHPDCESLLNGIFDDSVIGGSTYETSFFMHFDVTPIGEGNLTDVLFNLKDTLDRKISAFAAECIVENEGYTNDGPSIKRVQLFPHEDFDYYTLDDISCQDANQDLSCVPVLGVISISFVSIEPVSTSIKEEVINYVKYIIEQELQSLVPNVNGLSSISITNPIPYSPAPSYFDDDNLDDDTGCTDLFSGRFPTLDENSYKTTSLTMMMDLVLEAIVPFEGIRDSFEISLENQVSAYAAGCPVVKRGKSGVDIVKDYDNNFNIRFVKFNMVLFHYGTCSSTASMSGTCYPMIVDVDIKYHHLSRRLLGRLLGEADEIQEFVFGIIQREINHIAQDIAGIEAITVIRSMDAPILTMNNGSKAAIGVSVSISIIGMSIYTFMKLKKKQPEKEFDEPISLDEISQHADADTVLRNWKLNNMTNGRIESQKRDFELSDNDLSILRQWNNSSSSLVRPTKSEEKQIKLSQYLAANVKTNINKSQHKEMAKSSYSNMDNGIQHPSLASNLNSFKHRHRTTEMNNINDDDLSVDESCYNDDFVDNDDDISIISDYTMQH